MLHIFYLDLLCHYQMKEKMPNEEALKQNLFTHFWHASDLCLFHMITILAKEHPTLQSLTSSDFFHQYLLYDNNMNKVQNRQRVFTEIIKKPVSTY